MVPTDLTQIDTSVFSSIALASQTTAFNTTLGTYDYLTIAIAVVACVVSFISLYIAKLTLDSQVQTEMNTRSISVDNLVTMLNKLLGVAYIGFVRSSVLKTKWAAAEYEGYPHNDIIEYMKFPVDYVQAELCSALEEQQYISLLELKRVLVDYNSRLVRRFANFYNPEIPTEIKKRDLNRMELESCWTIKRIVEVINAVSGENRVKESLQTIRMTSSDFADDATAVDQTVKIPLPECLQIIDSFPEEDLEVFKSMLESNLKVFYGSDKRGDEYVCIINTEKE